MPKVSKEEAQQQKMVVRFLEELKKQMPELLYTSTNMGSYMNVGQVLVAKAMGYTKGTPDLFIFNTGQFGKIICIEMKKKGGRQSEDQKSWQQLMEKIGGGYCLCFSAEEVIAQIRFHLGV